MKIKESVQEEFRMNKGVIWTISKALDITREEAKDLLVEEGLRRIFNNKIIDNAKDISSYIKKHYLEEK